MMMHRMSPLMASDESDDDDDVSRTPSSPCKMAKRRGSPETSENDLIQDADDASDGKHSPTDQKGGQRRTYSYMSPISSDGDDVPEKPRRRTQSMKSSQEEMPKRRGSVKKTQRCSDLSPAKCESELEVSEKKRLQAFPKGSDHESGNVVTGKAKAAKRQNNKQAASSADSHSRTFFDKLTKSTLVSKKPKRKCRMLAEKLDGKLSDKLSDMSEVRVGSMSEDEYANDSTEHRAKNGAEKFLRRGRSGSASSAKDNDLGGKSRKRRVEVTPKWKSQALKQFLGESDRLKQSTDEGSSSKPRVKRKDGVGDLKSVPIECEICSRSIRCKAILARHMLTHTGEKPFECNECGKHYTSSSNLRIHQLSHSGKMDYACNECGQKFTHLPYLKRHLLRHSGKKMHICEHCGKGFIQKYHLLRHILVHTRQTPYVCDKCGMSFNRTDYLKLHLRNVHQIESNASNAKPDKLYKCEICDKYFANHTSLEIHKRIHTGDKPYSCVICSRQFKQSSHLYSHMVTHSSEKPHACNLCELKFTRKSYLRKHKERVHSADGDPQSS